MLKLNKRGLGGWLVLSVLFLVVAVFAGIFGFEKKGYFTADAGSEKAPKVTF